MVFFFEFESGLLLLVKMPSPVLPQWHDKASGFFSSSGTFLFTSLALVFVILFILTLGFIVGVKIKEAGQSAGTFVGEVAKDARGNVADVAERFGSLVKSRWALLRQPSTKHAVQEHLITAAATTGTLFRRSLSETKDKVAVGKTKVEEAIS